jgi:hypothetical protein
MFGARYNVWGVLVAYLPYAIPGHGQILGAFDSYAGAFYTNAGLVTVLMHILKLKGLIVYFVDVVLVGGTTLVVWYLWQRGIIQCESGILLSIGVVFMVSTHIFSWYTAALLPCGLRF